MGLLDFLKKGKALDQEPSGSKPVHDIYFAGVGVKYPSHKNPKLTRNQTFRNTDFDTDTFYLEEYTWENKPALLIVNKRTKQDIAVVSEFQLEEIFEWMKHDYYLKLDHVVYHDSKKNCGSVYAIYYVIKFY